MSANANVARPRALEMTASSPTRFRGTHEICLYRSPNSWLTLETPKRWFFLRIFKFGWHFSQPPERLKGVFLMDCQNWLAFVAASTALLLVPGPTVLLVLSYAISQGKHVALATVGGVALGHFMTMSASLAGLGALVSASATLFTIIKWIGAGYLIYLGVKLFRSASTASLGALRQVRTDSNAPRVFRRAAAVTALNPKSIAFFVAFVPQFVVVERQLLPQFSILVVTFVGLAALNALAYALLADTLKSKLARPSVLAWFSLLSGSALMAMGMATAVFGRAQ